MIEPQPIYGFGFFYMHRSGLVDQIIIFEYWDPDHYYEEVIRNEDKLRGEIEKLFSNMQYYLDQEKVLINGIDADPRVVSVDIGLKGKPEIAYIVFHIVFKGELKRGVNVYENIYEEEIAEYEYVVYWFFPENVKVLRAEVGVPYYIENDGRTLFFKVKPGTRVGGREAIYFQLE
ncbi:MAG: hypothetical protein B6U89_04965 [Desulfurococcales archaeon ex4484_58]|nr:MAG: hypothetical protein B6U89_04965 [Desulfurococcales archaeon ex4484_58]